MPFSSVLGASSVVKPGVCTSATRPTVPYVGQLIFETDTNRLSVWNGSSWIYMVDADTPPGLELVKTQTIGSGITSVDVTNAFNSTYDNYKVFVSNATSSVANQSWKMTFNGMTTGVYGTQLYDLYTGGSTGYLRQNNGSYIDVGFTSATTGQMSTTFDVVGPNLATRTAVSGLWLSGSYQGWFAHTVDNTTQYTGFSLVAGNGTTTGGTIRVYGYRNS